MYNIIMALVYIIISMLTWISVCFKISGLIWGEETLFSSKTKAVILYIVSIIVAVILTLIGYMYITIFQQLI